jgi:hypothetical protein
MLSLCSYLFQTSAVTTFPGVICHENAWHVVIDTNVLLENLDFVQHLRDSNYEGNIALLNIV